MEWEGWTQFCPRLQNTFCFMESDSWLKEKQSNFFLYNGERIHFLKQMILGQLDTFSTLKKSEVPPVPHIIYRR